MTGICFRDQLWLNTYPLNRNLVFDYFELSPFYDYTFTHAAMNNSGCTQFIRPLDISHLSAISIVYTSGPTEVKPEEQVAYTVLTTINLKERAKLRSWQRLVGNQPSPPVARGWGRIPRGRTLGGREAGVECDKKWWLHLMLMLTCLISQYQDYTALQTVVIIGNKQTAGVHIGVGVYSATSHRTKQKQKAVPISNLNHNNVLNYLEHFEADYLLLD
ncbi:Mediator complex, subunit Med6 [Artemisia annua]|uniref:Mediator of RNA polymerase II transcription subunit 6 n=1 Tax=Artemisia annua TaxID=35608 RepID=A0A2U1MRF5_ARTAN|nr:Mediator complex, subunit Med6 [Artemisia annua]